MTSIISPLALSALVTKAASAPPGCFVEVGVYRGGSALLLYDIAVRQHREMHLFDTFTGMPFQDLGDFHQVGEFSDISLSALRTAMPQAKFHVGVFPDTMPADLDRIAFAHADCDQYRSVLACIDQLWPRVVTGGILWFDDYGELESARRAVLECFSEAQLQPAPEGRVYVTK